AGSLDIDALPGALAGNLDLHDFLFLDGENAVNLGNRRIRGLLHLLAVLAALVLADVPVLLELLEKVHAVPADVPDRDARLLGIIVRNLGQFAAALFVEFGERNANYRAFGGWIEPQSAVPDRLFHRRGEATVPNLDAQQPGLG